MSLSNHAARQSAALSPSPRALLYVDGDGGRLNPSRPREENVPSTVYRGGALGRPLFAAALRRRRAQSSSSPSAAGTSKSPPHHGSGVTITTAIPPAAIAASPPKSATPIVVISLIVPSIEVESLGRLSSRPAELCAGSREGECDTCPFTQTPLNTLQSTVGISSCRGPQYPNHGRRTCSLRPPLRRSETGGRGRMNKKHSRSGSSSRTQEAGHGRESTPRNPDFPCFSGSFYS